VACRLKKGLHLTTKGWTQEEISSLKEKIKDLNYRWIAKAINGDGVTKWFHAYTKADIEIIAIQMGFKILKVTKT